ncbi:Uncharacterized beta-barrel protein YwiB, DUF1934 family [Alkalithermobacter thermoalcaliphilus JW-YL-7 = DSM 7308]|uniref:Uncharacterized beta-barrel protein YwiB, DUF1934 family n=1 Tax=Alkalithermobacter thermoalcaliphilus JW-YL-7 = DSM 7308 TaxID=1121328 RepID=A0A150FMN1_CLOPD|nr:protein of unknown function DUF1934 [[Clostridium] paradoxum JW-YL-7 = DSM 7308]SHL30719.1 Uncharacterized beta-barrel protein YwiB, DUF1934 family [[Clostridium] paradoxum JW-YL-7 = DSM 7308]
MKDERIIKIKTTQIDSKGEKEEIELITNGKVYFKNNFIYIMYEETKLSGMEGTTTTLKIGDNSVVMKRFGNNNSQMIFEKGKRFKTSYKTSYGSLKMETLTQVVDVKKDENLDNINIDIIYDINISGLFEGKNIMTISVS